MTDREQILQTINYYIEGGTSGDPETIAKAFHPSAYMKFTKNGTLIDVPINEYFSNYIKKGVRQERSVFISSIDIADTASAVKLVIHYSTHQFIDFFNLLKVEGKWLIVNKIFHRFENKYITNH